MVRHTRELSTTRPTYPAPRELRFDNHLAAEPKLQQSTGWCVFFLGRRVAPTRDSPGDAWPRACEYRTRAASRLSLRPKPRWDASARHRLIGRNCPARKYLPGRCCFLLADRSRPAVICPRNERERGDRKPCDRDGNRYHLILPLLRSPHRTWGLGACVVLTHEMSSTLDRSYLTPAQKN